MKYDEYLGFVELVRFMRKHAAVGCTYEIHPEHAAHQNIKPGTYTWNGKEVTWEGPEDDVNQPTKDQ